MRKLIGQTEIQRQSVDMGFLRNPDPRKIYWVHFLVLFRADFVWSGMATLIVVEDCRCYRLVRSSIAWIVTGLRTSMHLENQVSLLARRRRE